mgnify:CR=1 FL=1
MEESQSRARAYWRANLMLVGKLLVVWFLASFGCGILFVDVLNTISIGGVKLGFFFAQQASIYVFVALIFIYVRQMNTLDRQFDVHEQ